MDVTFETTDGRRFAVEIWYLSTVRRMKECVQRQEGIPVDSQRLFFAGRELHDDRDTEHYSILHGSHVLLVLPDGAAPAPAEGMEAAAAGGRKQQRVSVEVRWGAKTAVVEMGDLDTVRELRARLAGIGGAAAHGLLLPKDGGYFFIFKQSVMEEDRTLRWHGVKSGDTVEVFNGSVTRGGA